MTDEIKKMKRIKRKDLVEMILQYQQKESELSAENERLFALLQDRSTKLQNAGSIAEASIAVNDVFVSAQAAADQYLEEIRQLSQNAEQVSQSIIDRANEEAASVKAQTEDECEKMKLRAQKDCLEIQLKVEEVLRAQEELKFLFSKMKRRPE